MSTPPKPPPIYFFEARFLAVENRLQQLDTLAEGPPGVQGPQGDVGPRPDHRWIDTALQFEKPDGEWGELVDLKGDPGEMKILHAGGGGGYPVPGPQGPAGRDGTGGGNANLATVRAMMWFNSNGCC